MNGVLIGMAVYSTKENKKDECLFGTLESLRNTVNFNKHFLMLSVNGYTEETKDIISSFSDIIDKVYWNERNLGTAEAINLVWKCRIENQHCIKMDDDIALQSKGWIEELIEVVERDITIGQVGLKRTDVWECPTHPNPSFRSKLVMLPHESGQSWIVAEEVKHCIGTCVLHSSLLLDKVGYLFQPDVYGYDDVLMSFRSTLAGFNNVFLPHIRTVYLDKGDTVYQKDKEKMAADVGSEFQKIYSEYNSGKRPIYYNPFQ